MAADRPEKRTIRDLWADEAAEFRERFEATDRADAVPLFVTLSGAEGRDIERLIERGVLRLTASGAIAADDLSRVVAIESNPDAELAVRTRYPGLRTYQSTLQSLIRGDRLTTFPEAALRKVFRGRVINLDFAQPLRAEMTSDGDVAFPALAWVEKLAQMHADPPRTNWSLCLTLHGGITWPAAASEAVQQYLAENCREEPAFGDACCGLFGSALHEQLLSDDAMDCTALEVEAQQHVLMALVPKKINHLVHAQGWHVRTVRNLHYGGDAHAPMVSWILRFEWDPRYARTPRAVYRDSLCAALSTAGKVMPDGRIR